MSNVCVLHVNVYVYLVMHLHILIIYVCRISLFYSSSICPLHAFMLVRMRAGPFMCLSVFFIDLDECVEELHLCQQVCQNTLGSYRCSCSPGFQLSSDGTSCSGE